MSQWKKASLRKWMGTLSFGRGFPDRWKRGPISVYSRSAAANHARGSVDHRRWFHGAELLCCHCAVKAASIAW